MKKPNPKIQNRRVGELYNFIVIYFTQHNRPPSIREMAEAIRCNSTSLTNYYLAKLEKAGKIVIDHKTARGVSIQPAKDKEILIIFRCPCYPECTIHDWQEGHCIQHEIELVAVRFIEM